MDKLTIPRHALVLVCDGARALLFRNAGDAELVNLETVEHFAVSVPPAHDLGTDRPGRVHQSHGAARVHRGTQLAADCAAVGGSRP